VFVLDSVACADTFPADGARGGAQIVAQNGSTGGYATVTGADVMVQLAYQAAPGSSLEWTPAVHVAPGNLILAAGTRGIRFRNYVAGQVATVSAGLSEPLEPPLQLTSAGVVSGASTGSLAYVENGVDVACPGAATTIVVGPTAAVTFDGSTAVRATFMCGQYQDGVGSRARFLLFQDGVQLVELGVMFNVTTDNRDAIYLQRRFTPTAGAHTYDIRVAPSGAGTARGATDDGGAAIMPMALEIVAA
jgi:hypothetical protein